MPREERWTLAPRQSKEIIHTVCTSHPASSSHLLFNTHSKVGLIVPIYSTVEVKQLTANAHPFYKLPSLNKHTIFFFDYMLISGDLWLRGRVEVLGPR